jgi:hypothetical protein
MPIFRLSDAARAAGTTEATIRQWLNSGKVKIEKGYGDGWAEFSVHDILKLTLTRVFVYFDLSVREAGELADYILDEGRSDAMMGQWGSEFYMGLRKDRDLWLAVARDPNHPEVRSVAFWDKAKGKPPPYSICICLDVVSVLKEAIKRLQAPLKEVP